MRGRNAVMHSREAAAADDRLAMLLADIRSIFAERDVDRMTSADLVGALVAMEGRPWAEYGKTGKPLTQNRLARLLKPLAIGPDDVRTDAGRGSGYQFHQFNEAFERYLAPDGGSQPRNLDKSDEQRTSSPLPILTPVPDVKLGKCEKPSNDGLCRGCEVANADSRENAYEPVSRCDQCGYRASSADPLHGWDWPGRPDGILLHRRCEEAWVDSEGRPPAQ